MNLIKRIVERERERLTVGVPLPSVQPPTLTSQAERHKTSRSQLSSSLDSSLAHAPTHIQRLPSDTCSDTRSALSWGRVHSSSLHYNKKNQPVSHSSGLNHAPSLVSDACLCVKLPTGAHTGERSASLAPPPPKKKTSPVPKKQQM